MTGQKVSRCASDDPSAYWLMPLSVPMLLDSDIVCGWRTDDDDVASFRITRHAGGGSPCEDRSEVSQGSSDSY